MTGPRVPCPASSSRASARVLTQVCGSPSAECPAEAQTICLPLPPAEELALFLAMCRRQAPPPDAGPAPVHARPGPEQILLDDDEMLAFRRWLGSLTSPDRTARAVEGCPWAIAAYARQELRGIPAMPLAKSPGPEIRLEDDLCAKAWRGDPPANPESATARPRTEDAPVSSDAALEAHYRRRAELESQERPGVLEAITRGFVGVDRRGKRLVGFARASGDKALVCQIHEASRWRCCLELGWLTDGLHVRTKVVGCRRQRRSEVLLPPIVSRSPCTRGSGGEAWDRIWSGRQVTDRLRISSAARAQPPCIRRSWWERPSSGAALGTLGWSHHWGRRAQQSSFPAVALVMTSRVAPQWCSAP